MAQGAAKKRKRGRPPLPPGKAKRSYFNTRLTGDLKVRLEEAAKKGGHSLSEEIERRLEKSVQEEALAPLLELLAKVMQDTGIVASSYGGRMRNAYSGGWLDDPYAYDQAVAAATLVLNELRPAGDHAPPAPLQPLVVVSDPGIPAELLESEPQRQIAQAGARIAAGALEAIANPERGGGIGNWARPMRARLGHIAARIKV
jgi:hypothetical protein